MNSENVIERELHELPFGRLIKSQEIEHESGLKMLRLTIREGRRFTLIDLDESSAKKLSADLSDWVK